MRLLECADLCIQSHQAIFVTSGYLKNGHSPFSVVYVQYCTYMLYTLGGSHKRSFGPRSSCAISGHNQRWSHELLSPVAVARGISGPDRCGSSNEAPRPGMIAGGRSGRRGSCPLLTESHQQTKLQVTTTNKWLYSVRPSWYDGSSANVRDATAAMIDYNGSSAFTPHAMAVTGRMMLD
jgi:hypothetical protein